MCSHLELNQYSVGLPSGWPNYGGLPLAYWSEQGAMLPIWLA